MKIAALASTLLLLLALQESREQKPAPGPVVGKPAPAFRLNDHTGRAFDSSARESGRWMALAFYPKASTPGCTREVCSLRDAGEELAALGVDVYGISLDDVLDQAAFAEAQSLNFLLLSDPDGSVAAKYGVLPEKGRFTKRVTFLVDEKGVLRHVDESVQVGSHGGDLAALVKKLRG